MYAEERRHEIEILARRNGRVEVSALADRFDVTAETIRRDLTDLERRGIVRRVHGGAIPAGRFRSEPAVSERAEVRSEEKERIAKSALEHVPEEGTILLDAGTTTGALAPLLPTDREITVVTNALPIAMTLTTRANIEVLFIGGRVRGVTLACVDDWATRTLDGLRVDVTFSATNGISVDAGLTTPDLSEAAVKRAMIRAGRRVVLLADHTKVGQEHFARFGELDQIDLFITDEGLPDDRVSDLENEGLVVVRA